MYIKLTEKALREYDDLPQPLQKKADKQFEYLKQNFRHPSLNSKKYHDATGELWQARIDKNWRFYFFIQHPGYIVVAIITHPK